MSALAFIHVHRAEHAEVGQGTEDAAPRRGQDGQPQDAESVKVGGHSGLGLTEREKRTDGDPLWNLDPRRLHPWRRRGQLEEGRIAHHRPRNEAQGRAYHC